MMELNMAMGKGKKHKASRKHKMVKELNTDRDIFKEHFTNEFGENMHNFHTEKLKQEEESRRSSTQPPSSSRRMTRGLMRHLTRVPLPTSSRSSPARSSQTSSSRMLTSRG